MSAYSLFGFPLPEADVRAVDDGVTVMQDDGEPVTRFRTEQVKRPRRCWCGRAVSWNGIECAEHDDPPDPDVCAGCDHQRGFHFAEHDGICFGPDCECVEFEEAAA